MREFVAYAKANPGKLSYGSSGPGTLTHLAMEQLKVAADLDVVHIPYRGIGPAFVDLLGGQTQIMFPGLAAALPHIKAGKVKPLAVTGTRRHALLPDVPTFAESGYPGFDGVQWYGIVGPGQPARTPIVKRLNDEIDKLLQNPELAERLSAEALEPMPMTPDAIRPLHPRRHRALVEAREGTQHRDHGLTPMSQRTRHGANRTRTRHRSRGSSRTSSPRIRRARLGATAIEREALRTLLNYLGCAIGASRHPTVEAALAAVIELAPAPQATLFGRSRAGRHGAAPRC